MGTQNIDTNRNTRKPRILVFFCLLALLLTACSSSAPTSKSPEPTPESAGQPQVGSHPPIILRVVERNEVVNGFLWTYQDIYFTDPDGDATTMTYAVTSSSVTYPLDIPDEPIKASAEEQKGEALFTASWVCGMKLNLVVEDRIMDRAGNLSEPVPFTMSCVAPQPLDTKPLLVLGLSMALPISLVLLLGFWLVFRKRPAERVPALRSMILISLLFMFLKFLQLVFHEGGHALYPLGCGLPITLYIHPFTFSGFSTRPGFVSSVLYNILGSATAILVVLLISLPFWRRRSPALLPLVMLFPFIAFNDGINVMGIMGGMSGDFVYVAQLTGLPAALFLVLGFLIFCIGLLSLFSLFPLAGLDPRDNKALFVLPAAIFLWSTLSLLVAYLFVPGSPIDLEYFMGRDIIIAANTSVILYLILGVFLAVLYVTLFRKLYPRLPAWLRAETVDLAWKDLRLPAILWTASLVIGLMIVI